MDFSFARAESYGVRNAVVRAYGQDRSSIGTVSVGDLLWGSVLDSQRRTDDCGYDHGSMYRTATLATDAFPAWIAPIGDVPVHVERSGLRYAAEPPPSGDETTEYTRDYRRGEYWPPVDDNEATPGGDVESIEFEVSRCRNDASRWVRMRPISDDDGWGMELEGDRSFDDPCSRPLLEAVEIDRTKSVVTVRVGVHRVGRDDCPDRCESREYSVTVYVDGRVPEAARFVHLDEENVVEEEPVRPD